VSGVCVCGGGGGGLVLGIFLSLFTSIHLCIFDGGGGGMRARGSMRLHGGQSQVMVVKRVCTRACVGRQPKTIEYNLHARK
jgi:hypothetical protein